MVDRDIALAAAAERDGVVAVVPPVGHRGAGDGVAEADHAGDLRPRVLALPAVAVAGVDGAAVRRTRVVVGELVAGVDVRRAVRPREHVDVGQGVGGVVLVAERRAVALGVPVVDEGAGLVAGHVAGAPGRAPVAEGGQLLPVEDPLEVEGALEGVHVPGVDVLAGLYGLARAVDRLLRPVDVRVAELGLDRREVGLGHVLGGVDAEAVDAERYQVVQVPGDGAAHVVAAGVEIGEADQLAVLDVGAVLVVGDARPAGVEVLVLVVAGVVVLAVVRAPGAGAGARRHVVDHRVGDDLHTGRVAGVHHARERRLVAEAVLQLVADRLVGGPPLVALDVLGGGRDLDVAVTGRAELVGAGLGDRGVTPLEERRRDVLAAGRGRVRLLDGGGEQSRCRDDCGQRSVQCTGSHGRLLR